MIEIEERTEQVYQFEALVVVKLETTAESQIEAATIIREALRDESTDWVIRNYGSEMDWEHGSLRLIGPEVGHRWPGRHNQQAVEVPTYEAYSWDEWHRVTQVLLDFRLSAVLVTTPTRLTEDKPVVFIRDGWQNGTFATLDEADAWLGAHNVTRTPLAGVSDASQA